MPYETAPLDLAEARRALMEVVARTAHDLQSPMMSIILNGRVLYDNGLPDEMREALADIVAAAESMRGLLIELREAVAVVREAESGSEIK
jgi:signal transduction histidine kinase